jgi:dipeptidase E
MDSPRPLIAAGGGSPAQEARIWTHFAALVGAHGRVLNVPWAQPDPAERSLARWAETTLAQHGIGHVTTLSSLDGALRELARHDAVLLGGGNTYLLLERLRTTGFGPALAAAVARRMPCYGGSAGAIVLGAHIGSAAHLDANTVGSSDLGGLDLCGGHVIWCHYGREDDARIRDFAARHGQPVIALPNDAGVCFAQDRTFNAIGPGVVRRWTPDGRSEIVAEA